MFSLVSIIYGRIEDDFWTLNDSGLKGSKSKRWIHPEAALVNNCVTYSGRYLGDVEVAGAKGIDFVKSAIVKLKFSQSLNVSEAGKKKSKLRKIELQISVNSVKVLDVKTKACLHQRPLHRISYCADDNDDVKLFAFIAKEQDSAKHKCFAFIMEIDACAITLTVGQAFDIAYKKFCEDGRRQLKEKKEILDVSSHVKLIKNASNDTNNREEKSKRKSTPLRKWTTFDEGDELTIHNETDAFENYLFGLQRQRSAQLRSYSEADQSSDTSSDCTLDSGTLFMDNMFSENEHEPDQGNSDKDTPRAIAKPPSKKDVRLGKKISWDGLAQ